MARFIASVFGLMAAFQGGILVERSNFAYRAGEDAAAGTVSGLSLFMLAFVLICVPAAIMMLLALKR